LNIGVVITAGGLGKRFGGKVPKQLVKLRGKAMWMHSAEAFLSNKKIKAIVLTVPENWQNYFIKEIKNLPIIVTLGGKERWQSVKNGIEALPKNITHVMVHDAARPFVSQKIITSVAEALINDCCMVAKPVFDTVKIVESFYVRNTLDRRSVWLAQTPQAAPVDLLKKLYKKMEKFPGFYPTDEASILEKFCIPIKIVEGNAMNDKITTKEELDKFL